MEKHIEGSRLAEGLVLIMRRNHIGFFETWGMGDKETSAPSMTKAITGVAAICSSSKARSRSPTPLNFMPEFRDTRVAVKLPDPATGKMVLTTTVPAARPITVLDLMRHTAGFNYTGPHDEKGELIYPLPGLPFKILQMPAVTVLLFEEFRLNAG
jgi:hypothetical protein